MLLFDLRFILRIGGRGGTADALDLGSSGITPVEVQVLSPAPKSIMTGVSPFCKNLYSKVFAVNPVRLATPHKHTGFFPFVVTKTITEGVFVLGKKVNKVSKMEQASLTWEEALHGFLFFKKAQGLSKTTLDDYQGHVRRFFKRFPRCWQSPKLKKSVLEFMADEMKPATFNLRLIYLKAFFEWCIEEGYLPGNPLNGFKRRKTQPRIVDHQEDTLRGLLELPNQTTFAGLRDYALILFTLDTGIRPKEAFSLTVEDFDLKHLVVTIPAEEAKTRTSRSLPILPPTAEAIHRLIRARHDGWEKSVPVFCSCEGTPLNRHTWCDRLEVYSNKIGVKVRPYDLRHSFALLFLRNGGHAFALQKTLGHTDLNMTKRYVNLSGQDLKETHRLASPLNSLAPTKKKTRVRRVNV